MRKHKKGFTIVELVIVIAVIGILSAILIPTFVNVTQNANAAALKSDLANAYSMYAADAADGYVDNEDGTQSNTKLEFLAQSEVALSKTKPGSQSSVKGYVFDSAWGTEATFDITAGKTPLVDQTYNGYYVFER